MSIDREQIILAALDEFAEVGFTDARLESIAERAKTQIQIVRALYVDKETLLDEIVIRQTEPMVSAIALAIEDLDEPKQLIREALQVFDQWMLDHPKMVRVWLRCALESTDTLSSFFQKTLMPSDFFERLQNLINEGQLRCNDLLMLSIIFDSLIAFPHMMRTPLVQSLPEQQIEEVFERRFKATMDLFEHGLYSKEAG